MTARPCTTLGFCLLISLATANAIEQTDNLSDETVTPSLNNDLTDEEMEYVLLECEGFAEEDEIPTEKHSAYIETCVDELGAAVKSAIDKIKDMPEAPIEKFNEKI